MSDQDEALLDEDLGDEEYDLGNDEEEALLADDYEIDRQNSYKGEEETDDVLDLGVTDALDDLEGEDENIEYRSDTDNHNHSEFYKEERTAASHGAYYDNLHNHHHHHQHQDHQDIRQEHYQDGVITEPSDAGGGLQNSFNAVDLREKLQKNVQRKVFVGNGQGLEDDDCDEAEERRNRFQNERIVIPHKMNHEIPDSLENVVTVEQPQASFRGRGRGIRGGISRGARSLPSLNFIPRFNHNMRGQPPNFNHQKPFRAPLLQARAPPMYPPPPNSMMQQQLMYNPRQLSPYMSTNGQPPGPHLSEPRPRPPPPFNPNQFGGPRIELRPHGPMMPGLNMHRYNCPVPPPYQSQQQQQQQHFQPMIPGNQGPSLLGNPGLALNQQQGMHHPGGPPIQLNQGPPMQDMMHSRIPNQQQQQQQQQQPFNNRPNFQQSSSFEARPMYDSRPPVALPPQQPPLLPPPPPPAALPPGHKILINPHFRGAAVQPPADARLAWDSHQAEPSQHQPPVSAEGFAPSYQNPYGQPQQQQQQQQNYQPVKSDDPYAYFSDVWQENKAPKPQATNKCYSPEKNYSRDGNYSNYGNKYNKSESTWDPYQEQRATSQSYRGEREAPPPRPRIENAQQRQRVSNNSSIYHEPYDQKASRANTNSARVNSARAPTKRSPESHERRPLSPKRVKIMSNRYEFRTSSESAKPEEQDMDPEMREYRKKMEEQKRLREKILQEKENRRKQAAMEKLGDESRVDSQGAQQTKPVSVVTGVTKDNPMPPRGRSRAANNATEGTAGVGIVRAIQTVESREKEGNAPIASSQANEQQQQQHARPLTGQPGTRRVVINKPPPPPHPNSQKIMTTAVQKTKGILKKQQQQQQATGEKVIVNANRTIVQQPASPLRVNVKDVAKANIQKVVVNTLSNQRVVLQKTKAETKTNTVRIENLAASTSKSQIQRMCQGIGTLESINMAEGCATIVFKTQSAALVFHKKYQRKMLDLSLINVHLVPTSSSSSSSN